MDGLLRPGGLVQRWAETATSSLAGWRELSMVSALEIGDGGESSVLTTGWVKAVSKQGAVETQEMGDAECDDVDHRVPRLSQVHVSLWLCGHHSTSRSSISSTLCIKFHQTNTLAIDR